MDAFFALLMIVIGIVSVVSKSKQQKNASKVRQDLRKAQAARANGRPAAAKTAQKTPAAASPAKRAEPQVSDDAWAEIRDGSIEMPAIEPHEHEGKIQECPAVERQQPRPRPAKMAPAEKKEPAPGLQLEFAKGGLVQAVVMAEILKRPEFRNGRRVIR